MIEKLFKKSRTIGICGNTGTGKSHLALTELINLKKNYPKIDIYVYGVEKSLKKTLAKHGIIFLHNKEDLLDLKIKNSVLFIDEFCDLFSTRTQDKQLDRIKRFFNRIDHLNDYLLISSAQNGCWNKFMEGLIRNYLVKEIDYQSLVNGTTLKRKVLGIESNSDYRLEMDKNEYFIISDNLTEKGSFNYMAELDSKKENPDLFAEQKADKKYSKKDE